MTSWYCQDTIGLPIIRTATNTHMWESLEATSLRSTTSDSLSDKLAREAYVLGGGTLRGISDNLNERVNNLWGTVAEVSVAYGVGYALSRAQVAATTTRLGFEIASSALLYSFLTNVRNQASNLVDAAVDTWQSPVRTKENFSVVSKTMGRFTTDLLITGFSAKAGAGHGTYANNVARFGAAPLTQDIKQSIALLNTLEAGKTVPTGTAFFYNKQGGMLTASHCLLEPSEGITVRFTSGAVISARPRAALPGHDIALLEADVISRPLRLVNNLGQLEPGRKVVSLGFPATVVPTNSPHLEFGQFDRLAAGHETPTPSVLRAVMEKVLEPITVQSNPPDLNGEWAGRTVAWFKGRLQSGMSGGPLVDLASGKVIGVNQASYKDYLNLPAVAGPANDALRLIKLVRRADTPHSTMTAGQASRRLGISTPQVVDMANQGKIDGFWVPKENRFDFEDPSTLRILKSSLKRICQGS
ncbi:MAG: trypsin-like peptidase domain-containing protein [Candidatus Melainabacteria bacterium]|nr:trypsin-like peptidase domain-containing protein [Candidatus Melainabacteria bacterium]